MKKFIFSLLPIFMVAALCMCLTSCGGGDDDPNLSDPPVVTGNENQNGEQTTGSTSNYYVVQSIIEESRLPSGTTTVSTIYSDPVYEQSATDGRPRIKSYNDRSDKITFTYSANGILESSTNSLIRDLNYTLETGFSLNTGRISKYVYEYGDGEIHTCEYDSKNRLIKEKITFGSEVTNDTYTYDDAYNMIGYQRTRGTSTLQKKTIEYTTIRAKHIPLRDGVKDGLDHWGVLDDIGAFGHSVPMYLIKRVINALSGEVEKDYDYILDNNGYVTKIVEYNYGSTGTSINTYIVKWTPSNTKPSYASWLLNDIGSPYTRYYNQ